MGEEDKIVLPTDAEAAEYKHNISGWVSRNGYYYGADEQLARLDGATHKLCEVCGLPFPKNSYCRECAERKEEESYEKLPKEVWNNTDCLYSQANDEFFLDRQELDDYCEENSCDYAQLKLVICEPVYAQPIDPKELYQDYSAEDDNLPPLPQEVLDIFDELSRKLKSMNLILYWQPGKIAAVVDL